MEQPAAKSPWWLLTKTPRLASLLGSVWLLFALAGLLRGLLDHWAWDSVSVAGLGTLLSLSYFANGLALRRSVSR